MTTHETTLRSHADVPTARGERWHTLAQVQHVIGVHLERFASEEGLRVAWHRAEAPLHSYTGDPRSGSPRTCWGRARAEYETAPRSSPTRFVEEWNDGPETAATSAEALRPR
ncbi:hypothetical protein ABT373_37545 [Streptomyces sp. NPDC000070]|uniref:hypothetical protein n=1 Tax=Streptomyces sp. NPDC000070 TaxID=3154240 RepID=UPI003326F8CE